MLSLRSAVGASSRTPWLARHLTTTRAVSEDDMPPLSNISRPPPTRRPSMLQGLNSAVGLDTNPFVKSAPTPSPASGPGSIARPLSQVKQEMDRLMHGTEQTTWPHFRVYVKSNHNNTIITFTNERGMPIGWSSAGECGFRGTRGSTPEAAYAATIKIIAKVLAEYQKHAFLLEIFLKGFGKGRLSFMDTLSAPEGESIRHLVTRITDRTAIKIGGTRAKKARRI